MTEEQKAYDAAVSAYVEAQVREQKKTAALIARIVGANDLETKSINRYADLTRHGCKFSDLHIRVDGVEHHFQADWLYRLLQMTPTDLLRAVVSATQPDLPPMGSVAQRMER